MFVLTASPSFASFHLFRIAQIYSNADDSVQFIVVREDVNVSGENLWMGQKLTSTGSGDTKTFTFPNNLPSSNTGMRSVLIATQGFAALGLVTPDYVIPNGFLSTSGGTLNYAGVDQVTYTSLPTNGTSAIDHNGAIVPNVATNFAGQSASVTAGAVQITPVAGVWWNPNESGSGFGLDYASGVLVVQVYSYLPGGPAQWYLAAGPVTNNVFQGTLDKYIGGQCISCAYKAPTGAGNDGPITITFTSPTTATANLPGGRQIQIQRYFQP